VLRIKRWNIANVEHRPFQSEGLPRWKAAYVAHDTFEFAPLRVFAKNHGWNPP
jgi:hypothetical protein